jgi:hypothetical protein
MESASQSETSSEPPPSKLAHLLGILIALLTVAFPLFAIARFSYPRSEVLQVPNYPLVRARE